MKRLLRVVVRPLQAGTVRLSVEASRYVARVHRLGPGDAFLAFDPTVGLSAQATVVAVGRQGVEVRVQEPTDALSFPPLPVTLVQSLGKGNKPDRVVRDATALGVGRVVVVESERTVVRLGERGPERRARWQKIAAEAARQCGRADVPDLIGPVRLADALGALGTDADLRVVLEPGASRSLGAVLASWQPPTPLWILIGPEGGLSSDEVRLVAEAGFEPVSFGPFVLRTETAAVAVLGAVVGRVR